MIILPNGYDPPSGRLVHRHRPVRDEELHGEGRRQLVHPQRAYWGTKALPAATEFTFYTDQPPQILALTGGHHRRPRAVLRVRRRALLTGAPYNIIKLKSSAHRELSMRCDQGPFTDARVRQAIALT
jgi:hypothetical protein